MGIFSWLKSEGNSPKRKTIAPNSKQFTTGVEEIVSPMAGIAFTPTAGWAPFTTELKQDPANTRIMEINLLGRAGMISGIVFAREGISVPEQMDKFIAKLNPDIVERRTISTPTGLSVEYLHTAGIDPKSRAMAHVFYLFFMNSAGHVVDLHCLGSDEPALRATVDSFLRTLRLLS